MWFISFVFNPLSAGLETDFQGVFSTSIFFPLKPFPHLCLFLFSFSLCPLDLKKIKIKI